MTSRMARNSRSLPEISGRARMMPWGTAQEGGRNRLDDLSQGVTTHVNFVFPEEHVSGWRSLCGAEHALARFVGRPLVLHLRHDAVRNNGQGIYQAGRCRRHEWGFEKGAGTGREMGFRNDRAKRG